MLRQNILAFGRRRTVWGQRGIYGASVHYTYQSDRWEKTRPGDFPKESACPRHLVFSYSELPLSETRRAASSLLSAPWENIIPSSKKACFPCMGMSFRWLRYVPLRNVKRQTLNVKRQEYCVYWRFMFAFWRFQWLFQNSKTSHNFYRPVFTGT